MTNEDLEEKVEETESESPKESNDSGVQPKADPEVERLNEDTRRINEAIAKKKNAEARAKMAGVSTGPQEQQKPQEPNDVDYANAALEGNILPKK